MTKSTVRLVIYVFASVCCIVGCGLEITGLIISRKKEKQHKGDSLMVIGTTLALMGIGCNVVLLVSAS